MKHILFALLLSPAVLFADGDATAPKAPSASQNTGVNKASDASFDKRLPPVLPGERMNDSGHDMRVWSTAGGVPVSQAPEPFKDRQLIDSFVTNGGIVVDDRRPVDRRPAPR